MSGFTAQWLAVREAADSLARSDRLARIVAARFVGHAPIRIVDLGAGTGSNLRYLGPRLPRPQEWTLVDNDPHLLREALADAGGALSGTTATARLADLSDFDRVDHRLLTGAALVTSSALLDLVSERWLADLVGRCRAAAVAVLFALTYDGRIDLSPSDSDDALVRELVNRHQRTDKGFGRALGPAAADAAEQLLRHAGYVVERDTSDWKLAPDAAALQQALVDGWAAAAREIDPARAGEIDRWRTRRSEWIAGRSSRMLVGHVDLAAWPAGRTSAGGSD